MQGVSVANHEQASFYSVYKTLLASKSRGKILAKSHRPHSSEDRALPSGGRDPRSSRGGGTIQAQSPEAVRRYFLFFKNISAGNMDIQAMTPVWETVLQYPGGVETAEIAF